MFRLDYKVGCPLYLMTVDGFDGFVTHLVNHDVTLMMVSRESLARLLEHREWVSQGSPWVSSAGGGFNYDFNVSIIEDQQHAGSIGYSYVRSSHVVGVPGSLKPVQQLTNTCDTDASTYVRDRLSMSAFMLEDGIMYHTYSIYACGFDGLWGVYQQLDRALLDRNEICV